MPTVHQQLGHFAQGEVLWNSAYHLTCLRYLQPQELIALAVLPRTRLEEPHENLPLFVILPFHDSLEQLYYNTRFIGIAFILTGCILFISDKMPQGRKNARTMTVLDALMIGAAQAIATIPGISRSGSTITAGLATGQSRSHAMKYSLLMSVPAVLGANLLSLIKALKNGVDWSCLPAYLVGTLVAMVVGYFSIIALQRMLHSGKFGKFSYYMWGIGIIALIASLF